MIAVVFYFSHMHKRAHTTQRYRRKERESKQRTNVERVMLRSQAAAQGYGKGMGHYIRTREIEEKDCGIERGRTDRFFAKCKWKR